MNLGFQPEHAGPLRVDPDAVRDQAQQNAYFDEAAAARRRIPGIEAAGLTDALPLGSNRSWGAPPRGRFTRGGITRPPSCAS